jgi:hypothetical protein
LNVTPSSLDNLSRHGYFMQRTFDICSISKLVGSLGTGRLWQSDLMFETVFLTSLLNNSFEISFDAAA